MPLFTYRALNAAGQTEKGTLQAVSEKEVQAVLRDRAFYPLAIRRSRPLRLSLQGWLRFGREPGLSAKELAAFTRQLSILLQATVPYDAALGMIQQESSSAALRTALADVRGRVVEGAYLADALGAYPHLFPALVVNMVRSGEASGTLVMILGRLADYFETVHRLRTRVASALIYPAFMLVFSTAVVGFMVTYIVPKITRLFENFDTALPVPTRVLIAISEVVTNQWWAILLGMVAAGWGLAWFLRREQGRALRDRVELSLPLWRDLRRKLILQRLAQTLGTMLRSGVELKEALGVTREVLENRVYLRAMERVIFDVQNRGLPLAVAMRRAGVFPEDLCQMVAIGEETASLDAMLENVANRLSYEVTSTMDAATALFEPVMILIMGAVVGFIVVSILLPMLQLNQLVG